MPDLKIPSLIHATTRGLHHVIVWRRVEGCLRRELPVLYIIQAPDRPEPVLTLFDYSKAFASRCATWHLYRLRTIGAFADFVVQCGAQYQSGSNSQTIRNPARKLFRAFVTAMVKGTIKFDCGQIVDETGLYWLPSNIREIKRRLEALRDVARWLDTEGHGYALANTVLPEVPSDPSGALAFLYTFQVVKRVSLLDYLSPFKKVAPKRTRNLFGRSGSRNEAVHAFPEGRLPCLLKHGFPDDFSGLLNCMFMVAGGLRESEGLHVWVSDVQCVDDEAALLLYHPSESLVIDPHGREVTRRQYLMERFNRVPRCDLLRGPEAVGWKGVRGDIDGAFVHWLPDPGIGQAIATAIQVYRQTVRDPIMRIRRHMGLPDHPYLLISARAPAASCGRRLGDPYSMSAFNSSWKRAVSLAYSAENLPIPDIVKRNGLTPHGCRHRYGQKLWDLGLDGAIIQQCMHHVNPFSQLVYTQQPVSKISQRLVEAAAGRATSGMNWGNVGRFLPTSEALLSERDRRHTLK